MKEQRMKRIIDNFIDYVLNNTDDVDKTCAILQEEIGLTKEEWEELGWNFNPDKMDSNEHEYVEIEFFEGDEGDLDAEDYVKENDITDYEIEWDDYRKGYSLRVLKED